MARLCDYGYGGLRNGLAVRILKMAGVTSLQGGSWSEFTLSYFTFSHLTGSLFTSPPLSKASWPPIWSDGDGERDQ